MAKTPRRIVVHDIAQARAAAAAATDLNAPVHMLSAPGAAAYAGPAWFREMIAIVGAEFPDADIRVTLDCGEMPGHALAALRAGLPSIRFTGATAMRRKIATIANQYGAVLDTGRGKALDLGEETGAEAACRAWLNRR